MDSAKSFLGRYKRYSQVIMPALATEKVRAYMMVIFSLFALSFFGIFAINPTLTTIAELRKKVEDAELVDRQLQMKITNLTQLQKAYPTIEADLPIIYDALPQHGRAANLLGKMNALANQTNIELVSLQVRLVPAQGPSEKTTPFSFVASGKGTYPDIQRFLDGLANMDRLVTMDALTITKTQEGGEVLAFSLTGSSFILFEE